MGEDTESKDKLLTIWVEIENVSERKKVDYHGWASESSSLFDALPILSDDAGNNYKRVRFGFDTSVKDAVNQDSIYPHKSIRDALVFELPIDGIEYLRITLPGKAVDEDGELQFQIPKSMIKDR